LVLTFAYVTKSSQLQQDQVQNEVADIRFELLENMIAGLDYERQECIKKLHCLVTKDDNFTSIDMSTPILELSYLMNNVTERKSKFPTLGSLVDAVQDGQCHNIDCPVDENSFKENLAYITGTSTDSRDKRYISYDVICEPMDVLNKVCYGVGAGCVLATIITLGAAFYPCAGVVGGICVANGIEYTACP